MKSFEEFKKAVLNGECDINELVKEIKDRPEILDEMDEETKKSVELAGFLADSAENWLEVPLHLFNAMICSMIHSYCEMHLLDMRKVLAKIASMLGA